MSRRRGQNPKVRIGKRASGEKYFYFQYSVDVAGQDERQRKTEVIGLVKQMTKSEAERRKLEFISKLNLNSSEYQIPSPKCFAAAAKYYREEFAPSMLRASTIDVANGHLKQHLEADWNSVPVELITIDKVNKWAWKKRKQGLSWTTIKNILRTMHRVLSCYLKKNPPFSLQYLAVPEREKLRQRIECRKAVSFSWSEANRIVDAVHQLPLPEDRKIRYSVLFLLAAASGLRCSELFALRMDDVDFKEGTIEVDESLDRTFVIDQCKNAAAYRAVLLRDREGEAAMRALKAFVGNRLENPHELVFQSKHGSPLREAQVLHEALHPALKLVGLPQAGMHAFRRGCNRRWELAGIEPAVLRSLMGHSSESMTRHYTGQVPLAQIEAAFSREQDPKIVLSENKANDDALAPIREVAV